MNQTLYIFLIFVFFCSGQNKRNYPPKILNAEEYVYKTTDNFNLKLWVYKPYKKQEKPTSVIVFFFGGGLKTGSPEQFISQSEYFSSRGITSIIVDYRVYNRHGVKPSECILDAKDAIVWIRRNAELLKIDANKIIASGGSAGGYLAAATYFVKNKKGDLYDKPNALVLFNPAWLDLSNLNNQDVLERFGMKKNEVNIKVLVNKNAPPTLILHGDKDNVVNISTVRNFNKRMIELGHHCKLIEYKNLSHGFFNFGINNNENYYHTLAIIDSFLREINFLSPFPSIN